MRDGLTRWILDHLNEVIWIVAVFGGLLVPLFRKLSQAREREMGKRSPLSPPSPPAGTPPARPQGGPARFDWEKWFEETIRGEERGEAVEPEVEAIEEPASTREAVPTWRRAPLSGHKPLTEQRPYDELVRPLTQERPEERAPLTTFPGEGEVAPLTGAPAYDAAVVPEGVGSLPSGGVSTLEEGYQPTLVSPAPEVLAGEPVSALAAESPVPAALGVALGAGADWRRALVLGEVLGRPASLRSDRTRGLAAPGL